MAATTEAVLAVLKELIDPNTKQDLITTRSVKNIKVDGGTVSLDVELGYPAKTQIISVSIAFPQTGKNWMADVLATAGVLLGPEKTFEVIKPFGGEAMFLVKENGEIREIDSPGWGNFK